MKIIWEPAAIERNSMQQIEVMLKDIRLDPLEKSVMQRVIHATGDPAVAELLAFSSGSCRAGLQALRAGAPLYCDVKMLASAVNPRRLNAWGASLHCEIDSAATLELARTQGITRAAAEYRLWGQQLQGAIVAIGNAPTALYTVMQLAREGVRPALVVGVPVGFVGAAESKLELEESGLPFITMRGTRGGSPVAAAVINALLAWENQ